MTAFRNLRNSIKILDENVSNFPIGAVSVDDFRPIEDRIRSMRETLKHLNARLLMLKAHHKFQGTIEEPVEDTEKTVLKLHTAVSNSLINNKAIKLCLHSYAIEAIHSGKEGDHDKQVKIYACMRKLFKVNDDMLAIQKIIIATLEKQLDLKIQCQNLLFRHQTFLKEQEEIRNKRLERTNPEIANYKQKINKSLQKTNIMKQLILNFIASSSSKLLKQPMFVEMLEKHRDVVTIETILKMAQNNADS
ncbi:PREDICTED: uncharacterized protein LOC107188562 [Dufourea novaeangliae]|uniref:Uncharacterized protein n=1 Tax=Dufourea novaeangliae TaxID=178035 RepID=A0A154NZ15_DUFNO|nr:PREDICTED: uncharacterized protein LOC107188562 [Dufourea novaeangliae]KZC04304.1 hypothetical protein WN55_02665 [Dufourea novaeangliae]